MKQAISPEELREPNANGARCEKERRKIYLTRKKDKIKDRKANRTLVVDSYLNHNGPSPCGPSNCYEQIDGCRRYVAQVPYYLLLRQMGLHRFNKC